MTPLVCALEAFEETSAAPYSRATRRMGQFLRDLVCATTSRPEGEGALVPCRRPDCAGPVLAGPARRGEPLAWICAVCTDQGELTGWEGSPWDRGHAPPRLKLLQGGRAAPAGEGERRAQARDRAAEEAAPARLELDEVRAALAGGRRLSRLRWAAAALDALGRPAGLTELNALLAAASPDRRLDDRAVRCWPTGETALVVQQPDGRLRLAECARALPEVRRAVRWLARRGRRGSAPSRRGRRAARRPQSR